MSLIIIRKQLTLCLSCIKLQKISSLTHENVYLQVFRKNMNNFTNKRYLNKTPYPQITIICNTFFYNQVEEFAAQILHLVLFYQVKNLLKITESSYFTMIFFQIV